MASIRKKKGSRFYFACFRSPDGARIQISTKEVNKNRAMRVAIDLEEAAKKRDSRIALQNAFNRISEELYAQPLKIDTARVFIEGTIAQRKGEITDSSARRYGQVAAAFLEYLGDAANEPFRDVSYKHIVEFRTSVAERSSNGNANAYIKCIRHFFTRALAERVIMDDPTKRLKPLAKDKRAPEEKRRPFTEVEMERVFAVAEETGPEWKWMVIIGSLTGQRLGDVANMHWSNLETIGSSYVIWRFVSLKTGRDMALPIPLEVVESIGRELNSKATESAGYVFKEARRSYQLAGRTGGLSNQFMDILVKAGIRAPRDHKAHKKGRDRARASSTLGFHSLRHMVTSALSAGGEARALIMDFIGHDSPEMSQLYTHTELAQKALAQSKLITLIRPLGAIVEKNKGAS